MKAKHLLGSILAVLAMASSNAMAQSVVAVDAVTNKEAVMGLVADESMQDKACILTMKTSRVEKKMDVGTIKKFSVDYSPEGNPFHNWLGIKNYPVLIFELHDNQKVEYIAETKKEAEFLYQKIRKELDTCKKYKVE